jgi:hypothetical protein
MSSTLSSSLKHCSWCNCIMKRGEKTWTLQSWKFDEHIKKLLSVICGKKNIHCPGTKILIMTFLTQTMWHKNFRNTYCTDCGIFDLTFTRSGRTIFKPSRLADETFVAGSGIPGCDSFDNGYDCGHHIDYELEDTHNIKDFVVNDSDIGSEQENSDSEKEISDWSEESDDEYWSESD